MALRALAEVEVVHLAHAPILGESLALHHRPQAVHGDAQHRRVAQAELVGDAHAVAFREVRGMLLELRGRYEAVHGVDPEASRIMEFPRSKESDLIGRVPKGVFFFARC